MGDVECQQLSYVPQCACVIAAAAAFDFSDVMAVHRQSRVQCDAKELDTVTERHYCPCNIDVACCRNLVALDLSAN